MAIIYICVPSVNVWDRSTKTIKQDFLKNLAKIYEAYKGHAVISVSLMGYSVVPYLDKDTDISYNGWKMVCEDLMKTADLFILMMYPDWHESIGVQEELDYAQRNNKIVAEYIPI